MTLERARFLRPHAISAVLISVASTGLSADLAITNARLFDAVDGSVRDGATIVVVGNRISEITTGAVDADQVIDAAGKFVMPGMADGHSHQFFEVVFGAAGLSVNFPESEEEVEPYIQGPMTARWENHLEVGITSMMSPGDFWPHIVDVRDRLASGELRGPRLVVSGGIFTAPGGHPAGGLICNHQPFCAEHVSVQVDDTESARSWVRRYAESGVDYLKITYDGIIAEPKLKPEVVEAIIDEAHKVGIRALVHPLDAADMPDLIDWGIDGFVHPPGITRDRDGSLVALDGVRGLPISVTMAPTGFQLSKQGLTPPDPAELPDRESGSFDDPMNYFLIRQNVVDMVAVGAVPVFASDMVGMAGDVTRDAVIWQLSDLGLSNAEVLMAATRDTLQVLMGQAELGTIEPGQLADILVIDGDPLADLDDLANVSLVIQDGNILINNLN